MTPRVSLFWRRDREEWWVNVWVPGRRVRRRSSLGTADEAEARRRLAVFEAEEVPRLLSALEPVAALEGADVGGGSRLRVLMNWFLDVHLPYLGRAAKTSTHYRGVLESFIGFAASRHVARAGMVSTRIVEEWQVWRGSMRAGENGRGPSARRGDLLLLRNWFSECVDAGELADAPAVAWRIPGKTESSRFRALSRSELAEFLGRLSEDVAGRELYRVMAWIACTGWRISDVLDLRWGEVGDGVIDRKQVKTSKGMSYPISPAMARLLDAERSRVKGDVDRGDFVFRDKTGRPWEYGRYKKRLEYWCQKRFGGVNVSPRDLRVTFATLMARGEPERGIAPCPPSVLKELMGHQRIEMTLKYYDRVDFASCAYWAGVAGAALGATEAENPCHQVPQVPLISGKIQQNLPSRGKQRKP